MKNLYLANKENEKDILKNFLFENNSYFFFFEKARRKSFLLHLQASKYNDQLEMFTPKKKKLSQFPTTLRLLSESM